MVISHHHVCKLTHDMNLLHLLPVICVQAFIVVRLIADLVVHLKPCNLHSAVQHKETAL